MLEDKGQHMNILGIKLKRVQRKISNSKKKHDRSEQERKKDFFYRVTDLKDYKEKYEHLDVNKKENWGLDCTDTTEVKSAQSCHENESLNSAATPDG